MNTVDWSPDGLQLASGDDKGVIQVLGDAELVLTRTLTSVLSIFTLFYILFGMFMMNSLLFFSTDLGSRCRPNHANSDGTQGESELRYI